MAQSKKFQFDYILAKLEEAQERLCYVDNNLRYIKALRSLQLWISRLSMFQNTPEYQQVFCPGCGWSLYDRVENSILDYQYGNRPF